MRQIGFGLKDSAAVVMLIEATFQGVHAYGGTTYDTPLNLINAGLIDVVVLDDRSGTPAALMDVIDMALPHGLNVLVMITGPARHAEQAIRDRGVRVTMGLDQEAFIEWIAATIGLAPIGQRSNSIVMATASAKGGASKTTSACLLAESFAYRGARVLVLEGDLSNAAIRNHYGFGRDALPYTELAVRENTRGWTQESVSSYIWEKAITVRDKQVTLDFLLGPPGVSELTDLDKHQWDSLYVVVLQLGYDLIIIDTGPEIARRPYALRVLDKGGFVLIPCPTGMLEREGAHNLLATIREYGQRSDPEKGIKGALERCALVYVEPERGSVSFTDLPSIRTLAKQHFPQVVQLDVLPRDARTLSIAAQRQLVTRTYLSPLDLAPYSRLSRAVWALSEEVAGFIGLDLHDPAPRTAWWQRLFLKNKLTPDVALVPEGITIPEEVVA